MRLSTIAGPALSVFLTGAVLSGAAAQVQSDTPTPASGPGGVVLNLGDPFSGLDCGGAYDPGWNLSLDQITRFAASQISACDLDLTLATIEGHVAPVDKKIAAAQAENWKAWNAAQAFLPGPDDPAAADRMSRVRDAQDRIQNARNGLRFLSRLAAVLQAPPPPPPVSSQIRSEPGASTLFGAPAQADNGQTAQAPDQSPAQSPTQPPGSLPGSSPAESDAIQTSPLAPPPGEDVQSQDGVAGTQPGAAGDALPAIPATSAQDQAALNAGAAGTPADSEAAEAARTQIACVNNTSWVIAARPAENKDQMTIDDPVAGQALAWLAGYAATGSAHSGFHSFAACPGAVPSYASLGPAPMPGSAQGLSTGVPETGSNTEQGASGPDTTAPAPDSSGVGASAPQQSPPDPGATPGPDGKQD